jgi:hypothetical protein
MKPIHIRLACRQRRLPPELDCPGCVLKEPLMPPSEPPPREPEDIPPEPSCGDTPAPPAKADGSAPPAKAKSSRLPIGDVEDDELTERWEWLLKACYVQEPQRLLIPTDINEIFFECRDEIKRRNLVARVELPVILCPDDALPVLHQKTMVRYLREPHLADFLNGVISFAPAGDYRTEPDLSRNDDEHVRPYSIFPKQKVIIGGNEYLATKFRMRREICGDDGSRIPYHLASFSAEQSRKLAREFGADGAVVIPNYRRFFDLLRKQLAHEQPNAELRLEQVKYYDPFGVDPYNTDNSVDLLWRKPIKFICHREVRVVILNGEPAGARINITISPTKGLLQLVRFN